MTQDGMRVVVATPLIDELCELIVELEPRIELICEQELLPPMRWSGDHEGDPAFERTPAQQERFEALLGDCDAFYGIPDTDPALLAKVIPGNRSLRWVHTMAAGGGAQIKAAGLAPADLARILVTTSAGPHGDPLAEFAVFGVLAGAKGLPKLQADQAAKHWPTRWFMRHLRDMTVCVVGLGSIGQCVARRFAALGARVIGVKREVTDVEGVAKVYGPEDVVEAVASADAVVNTAPGTDATHHMIGREAFEAMKPGTIVANVGRGTVIDEQALIGALRDGTVAFAALDVFEREPLSKDSPLWEMSNVLVSPHTAALDEEEDELIARLFAANATAILDGGKVRNVLNTTDFY